MKNVKTMRSMDEERYRMPSGGKNHWFATLILPLGIMVVLIFAAVNLRISFNQKIEQTNKDIARAKSRIHQLEREIDNLKNRKEELTSWPKIREKIVAYRLGLREANPNQVVRIEIPNHSSAAEKKNMYSRQRTASLD